MAETISREMGAPLSLSRAAQVPAGLRHLSEIVKVLECFKFEELKGSTVMRKEPIGVCGLITPWNWPMNQIVCEVAAALAGPTGNETGHENALPQCIDQLRPGFHSQQRKRQSLPSTTNAPAYRTSGSRERRLQHTLSAIRKCSGCPGVSETWKLSSGI